MEYRIGSDPSNPPRLRFYRGNSPNRLRRFAVPAAVLLCTMTILLGWIGLSGAPSAMAETFESWLPYRISTGSMNSMPRLHGNHVVWLGLVGNRTQVFLHDITTGATSQITQGTTWNYEYLDIQGDWVAMQADNGTHSEIFLYDIAAQTLTRLTNNNTDDEHPSISSGRVVWSGFDGQDWELFLYDTANGQTTRVTNDATDQQDPQFDGSWVVSIGHWAPHDWDVLLDGVNVSFSRLLRTDADDFSPQVRGNFVVWERADPSGGVDIYLHDIAQQKTTNLTPATSLDQHASMDGGRIVWERWDGEDYELVLYDIAAATLTQLTNNSFSDYSPDVTGHELVWSADTNYPWTDVYYRDLGQPGYGSPERLTIETAARAVYPQVDRERVVWVRQGNQYDIFLARKVDFPVYPVVPLPSVTPFTDVPAPHPYHAAIHGLRALGAVSGYPDNTFRPDNNLLRAQFAKMIVEVLKMTDAQGAQVNEGMTAPFNDLGPDDLQTLYPHEYVAVVASRGVTVGTAPGVFSPWLNITRAQMITMVVRAAQSMKPGLLNTPPPGYQGGLGNFSPTHGANMQLAQHNGLLAGLVGFGPGWDPWRAATRGECAQVLWNLVQRIGP